LNQLLFEAIEKYNKADALQVRSEQYTPISHATLLDRIRRVSYGLREIGIRRGDRVAIVSENRPEWAIADFACLTSGVTDVPLYRASRQNSSATPS
jgi:long-chain acyl-CoA synthetase